ncbi:MAG: quinone-dependent dihydroorotate dehydrogenase [Deltaproteobacteria bacterium]|nr:quinone-dependent dihydroorotate dehydrogenase [Deltaproteobacteria bacterium]
MGLYPLIRPLFFRLNPERAHRLVFRLVRGASVLPGFYPVERGLFQYRHPVLETRLWGLDFANPVGVAAGFDKDGELVDPLLGLGFSMVEVGTVTPRPQPGNPKPRLFRLEQDQALINRMGFNNQGAYSLASRLSRPRRNPGLVGVNLGKNKDTPLDSAGEDYLIAMHALYDVADYLVVNVSSPNTPGLRLLQGKPSLETLMTLLTGEREKLSAIRGRRVPMLLKVSPDLTPEGLEDVAAVVLAGRVDGVIAANTTLGREGLTSPLAVETGGLSGKPLQDTTLRVVAQLYRLLEGRTPIIGVGGVMDAGDAYRLIRAGASLVQVYSGLVYRGPGLAKQINRGLTALLEKDGLNSVTQAVGLDHQKVLSPPKPSAKKPAGTQPKGERPRPPEQTGEKPAKKPTAKAKKPGKS